MLVKGQIAAIMPPSFTDRWGNKYQEVTVRTVQGDITGQKASKQELTQNDVYTQVEWDCEVKQNQKGNNYNKFTKLQDPQYASQNVQQAPQQPAQATTPPYNALHSPQSYPQGKKEPDWDAKDLRMARMNSLTNSTKLICLIAEANKDIDIKGKDREGLANLVTQTADIILHYIYNGLTKKQTPAQNQSIPNEPIKAQFCDECRNLKEECSCDRVPF